jgi:FG-GAP repeat protein
VTPVSLPSPSHRPPTATRASAGRRVAACAALAGALLAAVASSARADTLDLLTAANIRIDGANAADMVGTTVAVVGDQNGDGRPDLAIGVSQAGNDNQDTSGSVYVVYSQAAPTVVNLANLGPAGYRIDGANSFDAAGTSVASAGDVNGDKIPDILIGAPGVSDLRAGAGAVYVLFGGARTGTLNLGQLGANGFVISGERNSDAAGSSVAGAGDLNGDGFPDFLVGSLGAGGMAKPGAGSVYAIFGPKPGDTTEMDLAGLGDPGSNVQGFRVDGAAAGDGVGSSIASIGDQNGDGVPDLAIGLPSQTRNGRSQSGVVFVVFGSNQTSATPINVGKLGAKGYEVDGAAALEGLGASVAGIGDQNGDGRPDLLMGSPNAGNNARAGSGSAYVLYSSAGAGVIDLASLGARGYRVDGATAGEGLGSAVANAGDVNGDGRQDLLLGAPGAANNGRAGSGSVYVLPAPAGPTTVDLAAPVIGLLRIDGAVAGDLLGTSVAAAGDLTGDGVPDVVAGAPNASNGGLAGSGSFHVATYRVSSLAPVASTSPAASVTATSAVLNGQLAAGAQAATYRFDWGTTTAYGQQTPGASLPPSAAPQPVSATISGLVAGTAYHFRLVATSPAGTSTGADQTFITTAKPGVKPIGPTTGAIKLSLLRAIPTRFATKLPAVCRTRLVPRSPVARSCARARLRLGTLIRFNLSGKARVQLQFRRVGKSKVLGVIAGKGVRGLNRFRFLGKIKRVTLGNGTYTITVLAGSGATASAPAKVRFTIRNPSR